MLGAAHPHLAIHARELAANDVPDKVIDELDRSLEEPDAAEQYGSGSISALEPEAAVAIWNDAMAAEGPSFFEGSQPIVHSCGASSPGLDAGFHAWFSPRTGWPHR